MNSQEAVIDLRNLAVRYGRAVAVDGVDLEISAGSVYALLGRNGAGKSSLVRCLLGFQKPSGGQAQLFGQDIWKHRTAVISRVGVVPEEPDAPPEMTPKEILAFCSRLYPAWDGGSALDRLARFEVPTATQFGKLSKGQKRQVALAVALASHPDLLVLDDPTLGLDVVARKELFEELVADLADRGTTVFITTHDLPGIEAIANRVGILKNGRLVLDEDLEALKWRFRRIRYAAPAAAAGEVSLQQFRTVGMRQWGTGIEAVVADFEENVEFERFRNSPGVRDVEVSSMSLEEIFIAMSSTQTTESTGARS
ncbi:MAG TPA: ABC transporter ATP-binding protein [Thermoanaerobaculia bacterium]|nr:ABC transporter ATP-binding protein [Thermoanaerobaculia bacterium]